MIRRAPRPTLTYTLVPYASLFRATLFSVSAFQINFGSTKINTAGDEPDVLTAMNPAALKTNVIALKPGGLIIADEGELNERNLAKAKYDSRSEERRVGKECVSTCRSRWAPYD